MGKIVSGSYEGATLADSGVSVNIVLGGRVETCLTKDNVLIVEVLTEENKKRFFRSAGAAALGGLALGPAGMLAGLFAGGNKKEISIICGLTGDRSFIATVDQKMFLKIKGLTLK